MGQALIACAARIPDIKVVAGVDVGDPLEPHLDACDVLIDFTSHDATVDVVRACAEKGKAVVIGTTGHDAEARATIEDLSRRIPMVWATNFSMGVNTLFWLTKKAVEILGPDFDLEVVEMHHRHKKDAPSGTATTLLEILADARKLHLEEALRHGRHGITGARTSNEIGIHALRGGDVVGDHTVIFANDGERVELTHKASSRDTFANGALRAARWVHGKPPGIHTMQHVLGLE